MKSQLQSNKGNLKETIDLSIQKFLDEEAQQQVEA
jgi:hypothetical protein